MEDIFAKRIFELRREAEKTQAELAVEIGVSQKAIDFWEKGTNEPKASHIIRLAKYFCVTTDYLLGLEN